MDSSDDYPFGYSGSGYHYGRPHPPPPPQPVRQQPTIIPVPTLPTQPALRPLSSVNDPAPTPSTISKDETASDSVHKFYALAKKVDSAPTSKTDGAASTPGEQGNNLVERTGSPVASVSSNDSYDYGRGYANNTYTGYNGGQVIPEIPQGANPFAPSSLNPFAPPGGNFFAPSGRYFDSDGRPRVVDQNVGPASALSSNNRYPVTNQPQGIDESRRQYPRVTNDPVVVEELLDRLQELETENNQLRRGKKLKKPKINVQVFHTLVHHNQPDHRQFAMGMHAMKNNTLETYLSQPHFEVYNGTAILKGEFRVLDPQGYVEKKGDISFVIQKRYYMEHQRSEVDEAIRNNEAIPKPSPKSEELQLVSPEMIQAVGAFFDQDPTFRKEFPSINERKRMGSPFIWWYHYRNTLDASQLQPRQRQLVMELTSWIDSTYGLLYDEIDSQFRKGLVSPSNFQYLIRPGSVLVSNHGNLPQGYLAKSHPVPATPQAGDEHRALISSWRIPACSLRYNGELVWSDEDLEIELNVEDGDMEMAITGLDLIPLEYSSNEVRQLLESRGKQAFWCSQKGHLVSYKARSDDKKSIGQRFMIDFHTYKELHPEAKLFQNLDKLMTKKNKPYSPNNGVPESLDVYVFPSEIPGFNFRTKKWTTLEVDLIQEINWNDEAFGSLVADDDTKEMIQALVTNQLTTQKGTDLIESKGNGLILLLHGPPGTGKTYTAESVAEIARKPLYPVTCGDIGTEPEAVEKYLDSVFHLGKIWDCVVLLDEAEVFLEQRTLNDLKRNALVSVFLRTLEYYEGILILTTNRVGTFDEAFKSRISLALRYEKLTQVQRKQVWWNFIRRLEDLGEQDSVDLEDLKLHIDELAVYPMNGRQIRNSISTARQLALYKNTRMTFAHLQRSIILANKFEQYLAEVREGDPPESLETARAGRRMDEFFARTDFIR
ncbi:hypothetical protein PFICI_00077 [Pestalotiopsis fici W106-1]|uniref:AAA+ ATPase domain-containing protein n=1 Tax=Pestalotiopsis fici (strain W106-1 / CGMCC3.15140) TaxID=1229662 RepID=W3XJQ9_PESFW|nr:uncharacterized protein PFICI_00077 [Pestalotiopsis fici W106-1]ETS86249.1 hypothetical protein PFICI_00077 [Pestalotiopsis fici W106-1]